MTNQDIKRIAIEQSAIDICCEPEVFFRKENYYVNKGFSQQARKYYKEQVACNMISYGNNVVASVQKEYQGIMEEYLSKFDYYECFGAPCINWLDDKFAPLGQKIQFMGLYYLPDLDRIQHLTCTYTTKVMEQKDFKDLYTGEWHNALCDDRRELDVLGVGAYDNGKLIGLAACSADCDTMWQIGIDVKPEYRKQGIASAITSELIFEILARGKVPFYCSAWANIRSARNAIKCGLIPAWVEMAIKPIKQDK